LRRDWKYRFGIKDMLTALELSACETLIMYEDLDLQRFELKNQSTGSIKVLYLQPEQEKIKEMFLDSDTGAELEGGGKDDASGVDGGKSNT
jgi:peptide chain release factor subunit 1